MKKKILGTGLPNVGTVEYVPAVSTTKAKSRRVAKKVSLSISKEEDPLLRGEENEL